MDEDINFDLQFDDEDDCILVEAVDSSEVHGQTLIKPSHSRITEELISERNEEDGNISIGCGQLDEYVQLQSQKLPSGYDKYAGELWIYPTNYPVRDYQYNIVQQALFRNTLVVLPTGLGKTFIAAVVMYNLYRWFPQGKVVFMAPTKPLVAQQIHACYNIMGIPKIDTIEMTGNIHPTVRERDWRQKRVIFLTPQVMTNDISRGSCSAKSIKCVVVDEAHKALGNHAYCQVIRELINLQAEFRVLALSATPGSDLKAVQQVMTNLLISHIELRSEDSIDIRPYTHERKVEKCVIPMGEELSEIRLKYIQIMQMVVQRLIRQRVLYNREATKLSKFLILKARDEYRQNPRQNLEQAQNGNIEGDFALAMSIYHGFELLQLHGLKSLYNFLMGIKSGDKGYGRTRYELNRCTQFNDIMEILYSKFATSNGVGNKLDNDNKIIVGHPKMQRLEEVVLAHFKYFQGKNLDTRVMIFSQYRDSVEEIRSILDQHQPLIKVMAFIGQSSNGKITKGYTQKEQLKVMRQFREGGYNTLVSTCVGEEGLDIGDVDLIVCFDAHKSPIRLVQRMGRTGRRREGRIVMLVTEGKEEQIYNQSLYSKKSIHKAILNGARTLHFYAKSPRLIPGDAEPKCHKMFITVKQENQNKEKTSAGKSASNDRRKSHGKNAKISDLFSRQVGSEKSDSKQSEDEYEEIKSEFSQLFTQAKYVQRPECRILKASQEPKSSHRLPAEQMIDLSEWMPWQNRLQQTHFVGHSLQSEHLVKDAQFIELQQSIGDCGDAYKLEMDMYLDEEDVLKSRTNDGISTVIGQGSIASFFVPSQKKPSDQQLNPSEDMEHVKIPEKSKKGQCKNVKSKQISGKTRVKKSSLFTHIKDGSEREEGDDIDMNGGNEIDMVCDADDEVLAQPVKLHQKSTTRKIKKSKRKLIEPGMGHFGERTTNDSKTAQMTRKSIMEILSSNGKEENEIIDDEDFEIGLKENSFESVERRNSDESKNVIPPRERCFSKGHESIKFSFTSGIGEAEEITLIEQEDPALKCTQIHIPTPPRIEEVVELMAAIDSPSDFANINLLDIVSDMEEAYPFQFLESGNTPPKNILRHNNLSSQKGSGMKGRYFFESHKKKNNESFTDCLNGNKEKEVMSDSYSARAKQNFDTGNSVSHEMELSTECPRDKVVQELPEDIEEDKQNTPNSPSFTSKMKCSLTKPENCVEVQGQGDTCLQKSLDDTNKKDSDLQQCSIIETTESVQTERFTEDFGDFSLIDTLDSFIDEIDIGGHDQTFPGGESFHEDKAECSIARNKSLNSTGFATFTQAMACLHSSSSENMQHDEEEAEEEVCSNSKKGSRIYRTERETLLLKAKSSDLIKEPIMTNNASSSLKVGHLEEDSTTHEKPVCLNSAEFQNSKCPSNVQINSKNKNLSKSSQLFSPQKNSPTTIHQAQVSDDDLSLPKFELSFDFDSEVIPPTPEKTKNSILFSSTERLETETVTSRKRKNNNNVNDFEKIEMDITSAVTDRKKKKENENNKTCFNSMNESDVDLFEEVQNIEAMNTSICSKNISTSNVDKKYLNGDLKNVRSLQSSMQAKNFTHNIPKLSAIGNKMSDGFSQTTPSPSKKKKTPPRGDTASILKGNQHQTELSSNSFEKGDAHMLFEDGRNNSYNSVHPQSAIKKKKLSLKKTNSVEDPRESNLSKTVTPKRVHNTSVIVNDDSVNSKNVIHGNASMNRQSDDIAGNVSTPVRKDFHLQCDISRISKVSHLTPIRSRTVQEDVDSEESFIIRRKKGRGARLNLTTDEESGEESSLSKEKAPKIWLNVSNVQKKKVAPDVAVIGLDEEDGDVDYDDDFQGCFMGRNTSKKSPIVPKTRNKKSSKMAFLDDEALESGDEASSDEPECGEDCYEGSFIDNQMQMTQTQGTDMRAIYLKSVKSPPHGHTKASYRLNSRGINSNIFSQALPEDQGLSEYEEDSFCVGSEDEDDGEISETFSSRIRHKKVSKRMLKGKKRVRVLNASSSDDDDGKTPVILTQEFSIKNHKTSAQALMTSSEEEHSMIHRVESHSSSQLPGNSISSVRSVGNSHKDVSVSSSQHRLDGSAEFETSASENDPGGNFDLLDMDEWFNDVDTTGDNAIQDCSVPRKPTEQQEANVFCGLIGQDKMSYEMGNKPREENSDFIDGKDSCLMSCHGHDNSKDNMSDNSETIVHSKASEAFMKSGTAGEMPATRASQLDQSMKDLQCKNVQETVLSRSERLKKQKEKQERYRLKLAQVQHQTASLMKSGNQDKNETSSTASTSICGVTISEGPSSPKPLQILVDSREISGAQEIISSLRMKHQVTVTARQLSTCDYIISNSMAVDRLQWSEFGNSSNRTKLSSRLCDMQAQYQKCAIIIEADRVKGGQEKSVRPAHHTKYLDKTLAFVIQTGIKMFFTNNAEQTAALLFELCEMEQRKGRGFTAPSSMNSRKEAILNFVTSFPRVTMVEGLNLVHGFRSIAEIVSSPAKLIEERGHMSAEKARWIHSFLLHQFDLQMTSVSQR